MSTLTQLKRLSAYYLRHHVTGVYGFEAEFIDTLANEILERMPTADLEDIRRFMVDGNVNEWIVLGQCVEYTLIAIYED